MANRRKRLERQNARKQDQALVDALALDLAKQGLPSGRVLGGLPSVHDPLYYCVRSHLDGTDKDWNFGTRLGWLLHNLRANEWARSFFHVGITDVSMGGLAEPVDYLALKGIEVPPVWGGKGPVKAELPMHLLFTEHGPTDPLDRLSLDSDNASE
jgi:hypothetical protein